MAKKTETALQRYGANRAEALKLIAALQAALQAPPPANLHWGHVGDIAEINDKLKQAAHWAGIPGYVER